MPNIREYTNEAPVFQPSNAAAGAMAAAAGAVSSAAQRAGRAMDYLGQDFRTAFNEVGKTAATAYEQFVVQPEISKGGALFAVTGDTLATEWNDLANTTDLNDATIRAKFLTGMDEKLDKVVEGFTTTDGRLWAEKQTVALKNHLQEKTASDMSIRSAEAIKANQAKLMNTVTNTVFNFPDTLEHNLEFYASAVKELTRNASQLAPGTKAAIEGRLTEEGQKNIAQSAARGLAHIDPDAAMKDLASGKYDKYISGEEKDQLMKYAQVQKRSLQADQDRARAEDKRIKIDQSDDRKGDYLKLLYSSDPQARGSVTYNKVVNDPRLTPADREHLLQSMDHRDKRLAEGKPALDNPETVARLSRGMFDAENPTTIDQLIKAQLDGEVSDRTFNHMRQNIIDIKKDPATPELKHAIDAVEARMTYAFPGIGKDPKGKTSYSQFMNEFLSKYQGLQRSGTLPPNALDLGDPKSLISQTMKKFQRDPAQALKDRTEEMQSMAATLALMSGKPTGGVNQMKSLGGRPVGVPPSLADIPNLGYSVQKKQWEDPATGKKFDSQGKEVK